MLLVVASKAALYARASSARIGIGSSLAITNSFASHFFWVRRGFKLHLSQHLEVLSLQKLVSPRSISKIKHELRRREYQHAEL